MEDELLRRLGREQREKLASDPAARELLQPLDSAQREALLDAAFERIDAEAPTEAKAEHAPVVPLQQPSHGRRTAIVMGAIAAVAAAVLLWWGMSQPTRPDPNRIAALPAYTITQLHAGADIQRSGPQAVPDRIELDAGGTLELVITPSRPAGQALAVAILAESSDGDVRFETLGEAAEVSPSGAVRLQGPLDRFISLHPGQWSLGILIGPADRMPRDAEAAGASSESAPWQTVTVQATIVARP